MKAVEKIFRVVKRWRSTSNPRVDTDGGFGGDTWSASNSTSPHSRPGYFVVYVGEERQRFLVPIRFVNLPVFASLFQWVEEEMGSPRREESIFLPCDSVFFQWLLEELEKDDDDKGLKGLEVEEVFREFSKLGSDSCKEKTRDFTPPLQEAKA